MRYSKQKQCQSCETISVHLLKEGTLAKGERTSTVFLRSHQLLWRVRWERSSSFVFFSSLFYWQLFLNLSFKQVLTSFFAAVICLVKCCSLFSPLVFFGWLSQYYWICYPTVIRFVPIIPNGALPRLNATQQTKSICFASFAIVSHLCSHSECLCFFNVTVTLNWKQRIASASIAILSQHVIPSTCHFINDTLLRRTLIDCHKNLFCWR